MDSNPISNNLLKREKYMDSNPLSNNLLKNKEKDGFKSYQ